MFIHLYSLNKYLMDVNSVSAVWYLSMGLLKRKGWNIGWLSLLEAKLLGSAQNMEGGVSPGQKIHILLEEWILVQDIKQMALAEPSSKPSDPQTDKWMNAAANFLDFDRQGSHTYLTYRREGSRTKNYLWLSEQL